MIGVFADYSVRWARVKEQYNNSKDEFDHDELKDKGSYEPKYGQKISDCFFEADIIISNNVEININDKNDAYLQMDTNIKTYLEKYADPLKSRPTTVESLMAEAYVSGRRSFCLKRKVGAVITDKYNRVISAGYNSVPIGLKECKNQHGSCYKDQKRVNVARNIAKGLNINLEGDKESFVIDTVKRNIKILEACRALHAEESSILNLVGRGMDMEDTAMYVTTYPCNLCANKIVQSHIKKVVYFEPYPVEEAKLILETGGVKTEAFEGVTFRAFFRFYKYEP